LEIDDGKPGRDSQESHEAVCLAHHPGHSLSATGPEGKIISHQLLRSGMSVAANYRAVCRARSRPEFLAKLAIVIEEEDESAFWLELLVDAGLVPQSKLKELNSEANQLVAIFNASRTTAKKRVQSAIHNQQSTISQKRVS